MSRSLVHAHRRQLRSLAVASVAASVLASCDNTATDWTIQSRSPDGQWVATTRSQYGAGPGTAWAATSVYLNQDHHAPSEILGINQRFVHLGMTWLAPTRLEITYRQRFPGDTVHLAYQVVRFADVLDISFRYVPASPRMQSSGRSP